MASLDVLLFMAASQSKAIDIAAEGWNVDAAVGKRDADPVTERRDLIAAGPKHFPRLSIESVERYVTGAFGSLG